ncbi:DUF3604 domain-containing protein [Sandaracinus amylolyticus]|nr:DUF3604 domain-containing protein [Sandaracinus amylolyticus]
MRTWISTLLVLALAACGDDDDAVGELDAGPPDAGPTLIALPDERAPCALRDPLRRPLFGDLHVHTARSFDAAAYDVRTGPRDAYDFARGLPIGLPPYDAEGRPMRTLQLARPLDFAAITDHSEFLGEIAICTDPSSPGFTSRTCETWREGRGRGGHYGELTASLAFAPPRRPSVCGTDPTLCASELGDVWQEMNDAAEDAYDRSDACSFTTFVAYEWTGSAGGDNIHRNVLFRTRSVPRLPVSYVEAWTPERLWDALEAGCLEQSTPEGTAPCDVLAIPHNGNLGAGSMFVPVRDDGTPYDRADAERRARLEPLMELYQHKGSSECLDTRGDPLGSEDELCRFEELHPSVCRGLPDDPEACVESCSEGGGIGFLGGCVSGGDFARGALRTGLIERARVGANPFEVGFVGSTDTHQSLAGGVDESSFRGHLGDSEDEASEQLDVDPGVLIRGLTVSPGGLAVVWAEENSRDSIFAALRRRETYATSGTRIVVRAFAGAQIPDDACASAELARIGYERGVPMGGDVDTSAGTPRIVIAAQRDPMGAPLERIQLVIGTLEADGTTRERVIDVAGSEITEGPDATTCAPPAGGSDQLCAVHTLSELDASRPAFVYARVLEVPTCRWSHYVCAESGVDCATIDADDPRAVCCGDRARHVIRERAWTSPVWWTPR